MKKVTKLLIRIQFLFELTATLISPSNSRIPFQNLKDLQSGYLVVDFAECGGLDAPPVQVVENAMTILYIR